MPLHSKKMNLDYIRTFAILGQSRNMTEASQKLEVDTSYVSRHIKQLEEQLNTKLITLNSKNKEMKLTEAGQYFFEKYEKIYNEILLAEKNYHQMMEENNYKISIGIPSDLENIILKENLQEFIEKFPNINVKIRNANLEDLLKSLLQYSYDFIICKLHHSSDLLDNNILISSLFKTNYCFVYNPVKYHFSSIEESSIIMPMSSADEKHILSQYLKRNHLTFKRSIEVESFDRMISYVKDGFGVGFVLKEAISKDIELKIIELNCPCEVVVAYIKDNLTAAVQEFLGMFINEEN